MNKSNLKQLLAVSGVALFALVGCKDDAKKDTAMTEEKIPGIVLENMDTLVSPKVDFYNYVNGNWHKVTTIPDDESVWGGFSVLRKSTKKDVLELINTSRELNTYEEGTDQKKALLIYESELDTLARNEAGIKPLQPYLDKINGIKSLADFQTVVAQNNAISQPFMGLASFADLNDSSMNAAYITPGGLGLPERDYYLAQDEKSKEIRKQYIDHIVRMFKFIGVDEAKARKDAETILAIETKLAEPRLDKVQSRDARNFNNPKSLKELQTMTSA